MRKRKTVKLGRNANAGHLQDAWHYGMLIIDRAQSTFEGDYSDYPEGIRGQVKAYEDLVFKMNSILEDSPTWTAVRRDYYYPKTFAEMLENTERLLFAVDARAKELGISARTGDKRGLEDA